MSNRFVCGFSFLYCADRAAVQLIQDPAGRTANGESVFGSRLIQNAPCYLGQPPSDALSFMFKLSTLTWAGKMPGATRHLAMRLFSLRRRVQVRGKNEALVIQKHRHIVITHLMQPEILSA